MKTELRIILQKMQKKELIDFIGLVLEKPNFWDNMDEYISHYFCKDMFESIDFRLLVYLTMPENRHLTTSVEINPFYEFSSLDKILDIKKLKKYVESDENIILDKC